MIPSTAGGIARREGGGGGGGGRGGSATHARRSRYHSRYNSADID